MLGTKQKQPGDVLDYDIDFEDWLVDGDALQSAIAVTDIDTITIDNVEVIPPLVKVWLSGGESGVSYKITVTTTTTGGRVKEEDFIIRCKDC